jgi:hypothetical protein
MQFTLPLIFIAAFAGLAVIAQAVPTSISEKPLAENRSKPVVTFDKLFRAADTDGDGGLSRTEAKISGMDRIVQYFNRLDANKDDKVTREEMRALVRNRVMT